MSGELGVYASLLKDVVYSVGALLLFWVLKFPTYPLFGAHLLTWAAGLLYALSDGASAWLPAAAITLTLAVAATDAFVVAVTVCYIPGNACCLAGQASAPFTLGQKVCGPNDRYGQKTLVWLAAFVVALGSLTSVARGVGMWSTRAAANLELPLALLYVGLRAYVLGWSHVRYATLFWVQSMVSMTALVAASITPLPYVSLLLDLVVLTADLLVTLGVTQTVTYFQGEPGAARRRLASWTAPGGGPVPSAVKAVWLSVHVVLIAISFFSATLALTRPARRRPAPRRGDDEDDPSRYAGVSSAGQEPVQSQYVRRRAFPGDFEVGVQKGQ